MDTRRRAASDLVRGLCKFHEQRVIEIFSHHVADMLQVSPNLMYFVPYLISSLASLTLS